MDLKTAVQQKYGSTAKAVVNAGAAACCDSALRCCDPITSNLYSTDQTGLLPENAGLSNVEFLKGEIEHIPLPDNSVDVIISNCVINLSADKDRVLAEAFRVLRPGGRFAVSDVVVRGVVPAEIRKNM